MVNSYSDVQKYVNRTKILHLPFFNSYSLRQRGNNSAKDTYEYERIKILLLEMLITFIIKAYIKPFPIKQKVAV